MNQTFLTFLFYMRQTLMTQMINWNCSVSEYLPLIQKDPVTYVYGLAVYWKEGLPFAQDLTLETLDSEVKK